MFASWAVRVPAVKEQTAASSAALGLALLGLSAGAVATMLLAGALCRRFGSPRVTVLSCAMLSLTLPLPALARSALALGLLLAAFGAASGRTSARARARPPRPTLPSRWPRRAGGCLGPRCSSGSAAPGC
jgi:MFS family permease